MFSPGAHGGQPWLSLAGEQCGSASGLVGLGNDAASSAEGRSRVLSYL